MSVCTFFRHRDCPSTVKPKLRKVLSDLIENQSVNMFYVGNNGAFDRIARSCLHELERQHSGINYAVVLEHMPEKRDEFDSIDYTDTMPEEIEKVHPRFAIARRNKRMLRVISD